MIVLTVTTDKRIVTEALQRKKKKVGFFSDRFKPSRQAVQLASVKTRSNQKSTMLPSVDEIRPDKRLVCCSARRIITVGTKR